VGARAERREQLAAGVMHGRAARPAGDLRRGQAALAHPAPVRGHEPPDVARARAHAEALDVADGLAQAAVLVEVAAHEAPRWVVVRMQHGRAGMEDLRPAGGEHRTRERLVLGVGHVGEADLLPALAPVGGVDVGQERLVARALEHGRAVGPVQGEELLQLARDHRRRLGAGPVRAVGRADALIELEGLLYGREPSGQRRGVLREEADDVAARALGGEVARAAVAELARRDLEHVGARRARDLDAAVARAGVDDQQLETGRVARLRAHRREQLAQVARPVLDRDDH
jgi:hypothetical protein